MSTYLPTKELSFSTNELGLITFLSDLILGLTFMNACDVIAVIVERARK